MSDWNDEWEALSDSELRTRLVQHKVDSGLAADAVQGARAGQPRAIKFIENALR